MPTEINPQAIILFDGVCNLCNSSVNFVIKHDKKSHFKFASLQSDIGRQYLKKYLNENSIYDSVVLIEHQKAYLRSTAALRIVKHFNGLWFLLYGFIVVPPWLRNRLYDWIAKNRYRWFGKKDACMIPSPEIKDKFLADV